MKRIIKFFLLIKSSLLIVGLLFVTLNEIRLLTNGVVNKEFIKALLVIYFMLVGGFIAEVIANKIKEYKSKTKSNPNKKIFIDDYDNKDSRRLMPK
jgi:pilus assembly protein TadC